MESELSATVTEQLEEEPEVERLEAVIEHDIEPADWLERDDSTRTAHVMTGAGPLRIAALSEEELSALMELSKKVDRQNPKGPKKVDPMTMRRRIIAYSINKAYGYENPPGKFHQPNKALGPNNPMLLRKLVGELTTIQKEVQKLSGLGEDEDEGPEDFLS